MSDDSCHVERKWQLSKLVKNNVKISNECQMIVVKKFSNSICQTYIRYHLSNQCNMAIINQISDRCQKNVL